MEKTKTIIVGMPAFANPNAKETQSGSINFDLDEHPVKHAKGYGDHKLKVTYGDDDGMQGDQTDHRAAWLKEDWKNRATELGLSTSGNLGTLRERVEEYEAEEGS